MTPDLSVRLGPLALRNPVLVASGTYASGEEARADHDLGALGGVVTKSVTKKPRRGNEPPRIFETASGMLNSIGIMNPGLEAFLESGIVAFRTLPCARIVNVAGESEEDFAGLVAAVSGAGGIDALELNVSCPNVSGGLDFGTDPARLERLVSLCRAKTGLPLIVKLTPNVAEIAALARAAVQGGADILSLVNTYQGLGVDWRRRSPELGSPSGMGGLSGPAIKPLALAAVHKVRQATQVPIIGIGGITTAEDVLEFLVTGASAVQVGTANFWGPGTPIRIAKEVGALLAREGIGSARELIGTLRVPRGHPA